MRYLNRIFPITIIFCFSIGAFSQSGIYYAEANYKRKISNYQIPCPNKLSSEELYNFYNKKYLKLSKAEQIKKFNKKEVWGYRDCKGFDNRLVHNLHYKILEDDALVIYKIDYAVNSNYKDFLRGVIPKYYFSKDIKSDIFLLDKTNLKKVYSNNAEFIRKVEKYLESPQSCIHCYDAHDKTYIVNELLKECLDNKAVL